MVFSAACSGGSNNTKPSVTLFEADITLEPLVSPVISPTKYATNVVYELAISDFRASGAVLSRVDILDRETNETLASFTDRQLNVNDDTRMLRFPPWSEQPKLFLWIRLGPAKALPQSVIHRLFFYRSNNLARVPDCHGLSAIRRNIRSGHSRPACQYRPLGG